MTTEENKIAGQEGILAYEKETGKQAMVDGKLTDDFKAWALEYSEKLEDVSKEEVKEEIKETKEEKEERLAEEKIAEDEEKEEIKKKADEKAAEDKKGKEVYVVENSHNQFIREYTPEIHGDKRKELAKEFAKKIKGKVIIK